MGGFASVPLNIPGYVFWKMEDLWEYLRGKAFKAKEEAEASAEGA